MEVLHSFKLNKKDIPNYVIPLALVQAEIFWLCSAVYCIFCNSRLYKNKKSNTTRIRSNSAPASSKPSLQPSVSLPTSTRIHLETIDEETNNEEIIISEYSTREFRRASLSESCIRHRPSIKDELNGTTCPPVWWQKTRVMFGHTPIHENKSPEITLTKSEKQSLNDTIMSSASSIHSSTSINSTATSDPHSLVSMKSLVSLKTEEQHIEYIELSRHSTRSTNNDNDTYSSSSSSSSDSNNSIKRKTKLVSKIRAVFHHKRNKN